MDLLVKLIDLISTSLRFHASIVALHCAELGSVSLGFLQGDAALPPNPPPRGLQRIRCVRTCQVVNLRVIRRQSALGGPACICRLSCSPS